MEDVWFWLRILDYFLYGGVLVGVVARFRHLTVQDWPLFRWGLWAFFAGSAYATAEVMFKGIPGGPRLVVISAPLALLCFGAYVGAARRLIGRLRAARG